MPALTARRPSLCLFCSFAASRKPQRFLPHAQRAYRAAQPLPKSEKFYKSAFNPLKSNNRFPRAPEPNATILDGAVASGLEKIRRDLSQPEFLESLSLTQDAFEKEWNTFERYIRVWLDRAGPEAQSLASGATRGKGALETKLRYLFFAQACGGRFTQAEVDNQKALANLRYPQEWYPLTRMIPRTVHLHVGPTNSGKTYHALKRLEEAESGIYLGPLRLLAHEVYTRLNAKGRPCALVTGEEQRIPQGEPPKMWSCTVEMAPLNRPLDVAVIDEIQMINHKDRGWAWTQAFLGIMARELHVCGEARTVPLIRELCALVGDKVEVHEYERLTPLKVADRSISGQLSANLRKGDCIVSFSVLGIHALRRSIENATGRKCAIVYGSLPPETRAQQARLFNDPDNDYDFLVASDAIGMGLNLSIKRVIFESTMKNNGVQFVPLEVSEIKQIAGRAGRYKTAHQAITESKTQPEDSTIGLDDTRLDTPTKPTQTDENTTGYVTTLESFDYPYLKRCMTNEPAPITTAGLFPPSLIVERFANYFPPGTPFSYIMLRLHEISEIHPRFHLCALRDQLKIADVLHPIKNLSIQERIMICSAPTNVKEAPEQKLLHAMAKCIAENESGNLLDLPIPIEVLDKTPSPKRKYLWELENLHKMLVLYLWLSYRFPNVFTTRSLANYTKKLVEDAIEKTLSEFNFTKSSREKNLRQRRKAMWYLQNEEGEVAVRHVGVKDGVGAQLDHMPEEVKDVLNDQRSFGEDAVTEGATDYPRTPELDAEDPEIEPESVEEPHSRQLQMHAAPPNIEINVDGPDASHTQPRT